ncbi:MAG TPA: bacteriohopanetetrol glucosamine biosynthesis glycosyltransferase HpnI [Geobacteraceae bacterium]|nr:bacteriohopanetetrol glucosamine biosynthesis glycosyltransferase HpnI [Geobacteraceae bacterium]
MILPFLFIAPPLAYALISLWCARAFFCHKKSTADHTPPVTIIKPVKGMDADSYDNFASFCCQDYPEFQIIFAVASPADPAIPVIEKLRIDFPAIDMDLVVDGRIYGPNYKICNLINAWPLARHDLIIVCDSDIKVRDRYLREVCAPFADPGIGLVTSLYRSSEMHGAATAIEAMGFTADMVPNVMVALQLEGLSFALGASMAVRRKALEEIGGFPALVDYLADDYQLGNKVHKAGWRLALSDYFVESVMHREDLATVLSRQLRWARTMRVSRPGGYFASGLIQSFPLALLALIVSGWTFSGAVAALLLYAVRCLTALVFSLRYLRDGVFPRWLWLLPIRDMFAFATWALAFAGQRVRWRGHLFRLLPGGRIVELPEKK